MRHLLEHLKENRIEHQKNLILGAHSSFRIGGPADLGVFPRNEEELTGVLDRLGRADIPFLLFGNATNVVFSDEGYRGVVIFTSHMREIRREENRISAQTGASLHRLSMVARNASLEGLAFASGIPGTLGGGIYMNAGAYGHELGEVCIQSRYYDTKRKTFGIMTGEEHGFAYRTSAYQLHPEYIILEAILELIPGDAEAIGAQMAEMAQKRRCSQPLAYPNAGSVFKRPPGDAAARLIDQVCHLKGLRVGGAVVSEKHAGFIVNLGYATCADVKALVCEIQRRVLEETGISLETEIKFVE